LLSRILYNIYAPTDNMKVITVAIRIINDRTGINSII
jgi:hypothetical protein